jgi:cytochrome c oxidase assembly protein subunit 11
MSKDRNLPLKLAALCVAMFGFGFALVPLYNVFCEITGLGGKTSNVAAEIDVAALAPQTDRTVRVEFLASRARGAPWEFEPTMSHMDVHPGQIYETTYVARNLTGQDIVGQAVPSVAPGLAAAHLKKIECFCFTAQAFAPNETRELPLVFMIDPALPEHMDTVSLSYTLFAASE